MPLIQIRAPFIYLIFTVMSFYWYGCSQQSQDIFAKKTYDFVLNLENAEVITAKSKHVTTTVFSINDDRRSVLFEHPNSEVVFKDVPIYENAKLDFGIAVDQNAWHMGGDGVLFEISIVDKESQNILLFSKYVDPKNNAEDRRWFDAQIDLSTFAGQMVSFIFRTDRGTNDNNAADWAGWSTPQLVSYSRILTAENPRHTNVILISIDTLRPDHLSAYAYKRATSPNIDGLAKDGALFKNTIAQANWTIPSHMSILTSLNPSVHKVNGRNKLDSSRITMLTEILRNNGYYTVGFVDTTPYFNRDRFGFETGFDLYDDRNRQNTGGGGISKINGKVFEFLDNKYNEKFFLFLHIFDVHGPYEPPSPYDKMFYSGDENDPDNHSLDFVKKLGCHDYLKLDGITDLEYVISSYDGGIAHVDSELGKLFDRLRELGIYDNTLIVVTSDHGESLLDRQFWVGHGMFLYDDEVKIPLEHLRFTGILFPSKETIFSLFPDLVRNRPHLLFLPAILSTSCGVVNKGTNKLVAAIMKKYQCSFSTLYRWE